MGRKNNIKPKKINEFSLIFFRKFQFLQTTFNETNVSLISESMLQFYHHPEDLVNAIYLRFQGIFNMF